MPKILLVEDDASLAALIREFLETHGLDVEIEDRGDRAEDRVKAVNPDVVVLDIVLPGKDGLTVCRELRHWFTKPILVLTARGEEADEVVGLELGADDYIAKPVRPRVLLARVRALLRRHESARPKRKVDVGELRIDAQSRSVTMRGQPVSVSSAEFDLLWVLAENVGQMMSREAIMKAIRGIEYDGLDRSVDLRISRLRKKQGDDPREPRLIKSVRGYGYILAAQS